ncbi:MAG: hypothetical protein ACREGJ_00400 [Candidatus Saccharimonadales bacterium]
MKTVLLYRPNSEHERVVLDYLRDFERVTGKQLPTMDVDSREGIEKVQLYDIMQYPAILATDNEGHVQQLWQGEPLPRIGEVSYYVEDKRT